MTRSSNVLEWSEQDWLDFRTEMWQKLDPKIRGWAVEYLASKLPDAVKEDLRARIDEDPASWIGGRKDVPCAECHGKIVMVPGPTTCWLCHGTGRADEFPMHHGWGTGIRNLLRQGGFTDDKLGGNLDDFYIPLVEAAVGRGPAVGAA